MITAWYSMGVNHIGMWTGLFNLVNPLVVGHMAMWTMGVNHIQMWTIDVKSHGDWTRLLTLVQVGDWRKYALEAIIKLLFISLFHDKCLLFMIVLTGNIIHVWIHRQT